MFEKQLHGFDHKWYKLKYSPYYELIFRNDLNIVYQLIRTFLEPKIQLGKKKSEGFYFFKVCNNIMNWDALVLSFLSFFFLKVKSFYLDTEPKQCYSIENKSF